MARAPPAVGPYGSAVVLATTRPVSKPLPTATKGTIMCVVNGMMLNTVSGPKEGPVYRGILPVVVGSVRTAPVVLNAVPTGARVTVAVILPAVKGSVAVPTLKVVHVSVIESIAVRLEMDRAVTSTVSMFDVDDRVPTEGVAVLLFVIVA